ncbi:MAG: hypothetical protein FJ267_10280, partial [Planctomycetes bacterium]|nr:hypothetical protein [Planctomycetota bacterium]
YFGWIAAQYLALANVLLVYFRIPENWGIIIAFAIALIFTMIGGMWSVTLIDTVQILIAFVGLIVLVFVSLVAFGNGSLTDGLNRLFAETPAQDFSLFEAPDATLAVVLATCGTWATGVFGGPLGQDLHQRIFSARSAATARWACIFSGVSYLAFGMIPLAIGLMARIELPPNSTFAEVRVLMYMAGHNLSVPLAIIFVVSFVSIVLSTACSAVLTPATVLGNNFLSRIPVCHRNRLMVERLCVLVMSLFGVWTAYSGESLFGLLDLSLSISLVALFVPLTMGLYGKPKGELPAILAMVLGILFFGFRYAPEKIGYGLPESFGPCRVTVATQLKNLKWDESVKAAVSSESLTVETAATENNSGEQERNSHQAELVEEAIERARLSMHTEFSKFVSPQRADELTDRNFVSGVDWVTYMNLIFPKEKIGLLGMTVPGFKVFGHAFERGTLLTLLLTIPADLWGLLASFLGYFVGQFLLRSPQPRARL